MLDNTLYIPKKQKSEEIWSLSIHSVKIVFFQCAKNSYLELAEMKFPSGKKGKTF